VNVWRARFSTALAIILALSSMPADAIAEEADLDVSEPALEETVTLDEEADAEGEETSEDEQPVETEELDPDEVFSLEDETSEEVEITLDEDELELDEAEVFKEEADIIDSAKTIAKTSHVLYRVHRQTYGWEKDWKQDGARSGTTGQSKRLEAIYIKLQDKPFTGSIRYRTHVQKVGWQGWKKEGQLSGTTGRALRLEAIQIKLTGQMAKEYDVWYRVHAQRFGWMGWAKNGAPAGSAGFAFRLEAIQIRLKPKGSKAPSSSGQNMSACFVGDETIDYDSSSDGTSWQGVCSDGATSGTEGGRGLDTICAQIDNSNGGASGNIVYSVRAKNGSWSSWARNNGVAGTAGVDIDALRFKLSGDIDRAYSVWYRVHVKNLGWLGWAKDSEMAGSSGRNAPIDAYQVVLRAKGTFNLDVSGSDPAFLTPYYKRSPRNDTITKYLRKATRIAADDTHGYSQIYRWGPDYDCSSLVLTCLRSAGLDTGKAERTINMIPNLRTRGWRVMNYTSESALQRGDILIRPGQHTEFYLGNHMIVGARGSEHDTIHGTTGDQNGLEIEVREHDYNHHRGWDYVLRLI